MLRCDGTTVVSGLYHTGNDVELFQEIVVTNSGSLSGGQKDMP